MNIFKRIKKLEERVEYIRYWGRLELFEKEKKRLNYKTGERVFSTRVGSNWVSAKIIRAWIYCDSTNDVIEFNVNLQTKEGNIIVDYSDISREDPTIPKKKQ